MKYEKMICVSCSAVPNDEAFMLTYEDARGRWWYETFRTNNLNPELIALIQYMSDSGCDKFTELVGKSVCLYYRVCDPLTGKIRVYGRAPTSDEVKSGGMEV